MINKTEKKAQTKKRHRRIRKQISGTQEKPRLSFYKSNKHIYAQLIDDIKGHTLLSCSTLQSSIRTQFSKPWSMESAKKLGELTGKTAVEKGIKKIVFDRGGNRYHGKTAAFAEAAREAGLKF